MLLLELDLDPRLKFQELARSYFSTPRASSTCLLHSGMLNYRPKAIFSRQPLFVSLIDPLKQPYRCVLLRQPWGLQK